MPDGCVAWGGVHQFGESSHDDGHVVSFPNFRNLYSCMVLVGVCHMSQYLHASCVICAQYAFTNICDVYVLE